MIICDLSGKSLRGAQFSFECLPGAKFRESDLSYANFRLARLIDADFSHASLVGADLTDAYLHSANLSGADLTDAKIEGASLDQSIWVGTKLPKLFLDVPSIPDFDRRIEEATRPPEALDMSDWHQSCGTVHCRAGWAIVIAGVSGARLEATYGSCFTAGILYIKNSKRQSVPDFFNCDESAVREDIERCALLP